MTVTTTFTSGSRVLTAVSGSGPPRPERFGTGFGGPAGPVLLFWTIDPWAGHRGGIDTVSGVGHPLVAGAPEAVHDLHPTADRLRPLANAVVHDIADITGHVTVDGRVSTLGHGTLQSHDVRQR